MKKHLPALCAVAVLLCNGGTAYSSGASSGSNAHPGQVVILDSVTQTRPLPNGIEFQSGRAVLQITALRDDVIRIRVAPRGEMPEDASWAVVSQARTHSVQVTPERDSISAGFRTQALRVHVELATMSLRVTDLEGNVIQEDAPGRSTEFHGDAFRVYKTMPEDEHYFGLGDKVGPLDRRNKAFASGTPTLMDCRSRLTRIYKSIPFFIDIPQGRAAGVFLDNTWRSSFDFGKSAATLTPSARKGARLTITSSMARSQSRFFARTHGLPGNTPLAASLVAGLPAVALQLLPRSPECARSPTACVPTGFPPMPSISTSNTSRTTGHSPSTREKFPHFAQMIADLKQQQLQSSPLPISTSPICPMPATRPTTQGLQAIIS